MGNVKDYNVILRFKCRKCRVARYCSQILPKMRLDVIVSKKTNTLDNCAKRYSLDKNIIYNNNI